MRPFQGWVVPLQDGSVHTNSRTQRLEEFFEGVVITWQPDCAVCDPRSRGEIDLIEGLLLADSHPFEEHERVRHPGSEPEFTEPEKVHQPLFRFQIDDAYLDLVNVFLTEALRVDYCIGNAQEIDLSCRGYRGP